ncbi:MAG: signal peptidase [Clostridiales bacterium]|nr:signal peptidase [Clostridiales bacterium]MDN5282764.1 signal peptidase [Candidatus Ozemobacter sp.]
MQESSSPDRSVGVFIHDLSIRYAEQVIPLEALDTEEVLAERNLQLSGSISGKLENGSSLIIEQGYRPFWKPRKDVDCSVEISRGRFRTDLKLHNGVNRLMVKVVDPDGAVLDSKQFELHYKGSFREWNETIFIAFFLAIVIRSLVIQAFWIPTGSMEPTLLGEKREPFSQKLERNGDRILVSRFAYVIDLSLDGRLPFGPRIWLKKPERGDIIVFRYPDPVVTNPPKDYIKRVIGIAGDHILIENGVVYVNQIALDEPYIAEPPVSDFETVVPPETVFCLGDNRNNSADSRYWGPMPLKNLKGQAIFTYLPLNRIHPIRSHSHAYLKNQSFSQAEAAGL